MEKAKDAKGKKIALYRAVNASQMKYIDPRTGKVDQLDGRQSSGFADTNKGDGDIMLIKATYAMILLDKD